MRIWIIGFAIVFAAVMGVSFLFGGYLLFKRNSHALARPVAPAVVTEVDQITLLAAAADHLKQGKTEQALIVYREVLSTNPSSVEAQLGLAKSELQAGREDIAQRELERTLQLKPGQPVALLSVARIYSHRARTWSAAEAKYREYLNDNSGDTQAWLELARVLAWQQKDSQAADIFTRGDVNKRMTDKDWRDYAFALVQLGRFDTAEPVLNRLIAKQPRDFDLRLQLASIYASRKNWTAALPVYESLLRERPDDPVLNLTFGLGLLSVKRYKEAISPLERARNAMPANGEAGLGLARALKGVGDLEKADREFERILGRYHNNASIVREYADLLLERRNYAKTEAKYREYLNDNSGDTQAWLELARVLAWQQKDSQAADIFTRGDVNKRMTDKDWRDYAFALVRLGRFDTAEPVLNRLIAKQPGDFDLRLQLASIYASRKNWTAALPVYESLLRERSDNTVLNLTFGLGLLSVKRYKEAISPLERARNAMPANGEAGLGLARALKGVGDLERADREFERILGRYHNNASIVREYADLLLERRNYRKAEKHYRDAYELGLHDDQLLVRFAGALSGSRKYKEALPYLEQAYANRPSDRIAFELAKTYQRLGRNDQALALISKIESRQ